MNKTELSKLIKEESEKLGFARCGFAKAESIGDETAHLAHWLKSKYHADMAYLENNFEKRCDPTVLVEGAKTVISLALNYYPGKKQKEDAPQFAYYAYGKDYHDVMKLKLQQLFDFIQNLTLTLNGRVFCDTAPVLERYWAAKAGIGFIGKNTLLIIPKMGSFFFLGELIIDIELDYDKPLNIDCGKCTRCLDACPTKALEKPHLLNSNKCISYQTIENKNDISTDIRALLSNRVYGCDICQQVCPWNKYSTPHHTTEFEPSEDFLHLDYDRMSNLTVEEYQKTFKGSAVKRAKHGGLIRNINALIKSSTPKK